MSTIPLAEPVLSQSEETPDLTHDVPPAPLSVRERLVSLDAFRGLTIAAMVLVNNSGAGAHYKPLEHAEWHGWTPTDLIFPFFLFIVGVAVPFSQSKRASTASGKRQLLGMIWIRALALVLLGLLLTGTPFTRIDPLPDGGFLLLKCLRYATYVFLFVAFVSLMFPWKSKLAIWLPIGTAVAFIAWYWIIQFANRSALAGGLPDSFSFGNGLFTPYRLRFPGILQRIGICYGIGATIALFGGWRTALVSAIILMSIYSGVMLKGHYHKIGVFEKLQGETQVDATDAAAAREYKVGSLTEEDNFARYLDEDVWGRHNYGNYPDPEGVLSTLPAIGSVLLGVVAGLWLMGTRPAAERCAGLLTWGVISSVIGVLLSWWLMPINKQIWTPSFTVLTAGLGMLMLGTFFWIVDIRGRRWMVWPFVVYGMNAIGAFVFSGLIYRILVSIKIEDWKSADKISIWSLSMRAVKDGLNNADDMLQGLSAHFPTIDSAGLVALAQGMSFVFVIWLLMCILYFCKVFIKV